MDDAQQITAVIRDIVFLVLALVVLLVVFALYRSLSSLVSSARRTIEDAEDIISTVSSRLIGPAAAGSGAAFGAGKIAAFLFGLRRNRKNKNDRDRDRKKSRDGGGNNGG